MIPIVTVVTTSLSGSWRQPAVSRFLRVCLLAAARHSITLVPLTLPRVSHYVRSSACAPANSQLKHQTRAACVCAGVPASLLCREGGSSREGGGGALCVCLCVRETEKCPPIPPDPHPNTHTRPPSSSPNLSSAPLHLAGGGVGGGRR